MKTVVLAEKPSVGRDIAKVMKCTKQGNGFFEGSTYIVTWALGHLIELEDPSRYDAKYKTWALEDLPMLPETLKTTVMKKTRRQYETVKAQLNRKDVNEIVIATDAGREGELVARWILKQARVKKPIKRLWISSVTDQAIRNGFTQLKPGKRFEPLYKSAVARAEADWYVGLNATRALTTKFNAQLSSGRVQTPTLEMIRMKDDEIKHFKPQPYYTIEAVLPNGLKLTWTNEQHQTRIYKKETYERLIAQLKDAPLTIQQVSEKSKKQFAPQLYDLTELQRDANRIFGFSGKETLQLMQRLYERHKVLTYPRTDSRVISSDIVPTLQDRIRAHSGNGYQSIAKQLVGKTFTLPKSIVNDQAVSDHHAIIPTEQSVDATQLDSRERKIYDLVVQRFFAVLMDPYVYDEMTIQATVKGEMFQAKTNHVTKLGWKAVYESTPSSPSRTRQKVAPDQVFSNLNMTGSKHLTEPPAHFTEGTLLAAMENPVRYMTGHDGALTNSIKKAGGLGTVATRADIIEKLLNTQLVEKKGKALHVTSKGRQLLELVPADLKSPELTADWEQKLNQIAEDELSKEAFIKEIKAYTKTIVQNIKAKETTFKHDNITGTQCPECGKLMLEIKNKHGKKLVCQDRACGYKKNIARNTNARCPNCHKRMQLRGEGKGQMFTCVCGHRESLAAFERRKREREKQKVSKRDIHKYLKQDDGFENNALADAFLKLKEKQKKL